MEMLFRLLPFLDSKTRWKFRQLYQTARHMILSAKEELKTMLECLALTNGVFRSISFSNNWLAIRMFVDQNMQRDEYRLHSEYPFGDFRWRRRPDAKLDMLNHLLKHFCPAWCRGCQDPQQDEFHQDIAVYQLQKQEAPESEPKNQVIEFIKSLNYEAVLNVSEAVTNGYAIGWPVECDGLENLVRIIGGGVETCYQYISKWNCLGRVLRQYRSKWNCLGRFLREVPCSKPYSSVDSQDFVGAA
eukprot:Protomagalhaensia_wolfi_Nauph_80__4070@NODE_412_length_2572_cov_88_958942_g298_i1_p2_GENE_NODE_412_length_2572_cov_88_958942_g298_i1NODE_412_length_2572_cov_88_958942_g298_i1_p2_ORF_typecomplete_len244_score19_41_NODE_412_length_2572_cov_88_958942_g298_i176807